MSVVLRNLRAHGWVRLDSRVARGFTLRNGIQVWACARSLVPGRQEASSFIRSTHRDEFHRRRLRLAPCGIGGVRGAVMWQELQPMIASRLSQPAGRARVARGFVPTDWRIEIAVLALLFTLAALLCEIQYEKASRPESPHVLEMYLHADLPLVFTSRILPRAAILAVQSLSGGRLSEEHANALLQFVCIWGALFLTFEFARVYLAPVPALGAAFLTALFPIWGLVHTAGDYTYPYDFPALCFSAAGLLAIARRKTIWLVVVVLLGTANKETIVWLIPASLLVGVQTGERWRALLWRAAVLMLVFAAVYALPRVWLDPHHALHFTVQAAGPRRERWLENVYDLLLLNGRNLFTNVWYPFALHVPALLLAWRLHPDLRRLYWATPLLFLPVFLFGNVSEARLFNEVVPLGAVAAMYVFVRHWEAGTAPERAGSPGVGAQLAPAASQSASVR